MPEIKFDQEWDALPAVYKTRFVEILKERGLADEFDLLSDEHKSQILGVIKEHVLNDVPASGAPPKSDPRES